jgi:hypothetical protein
MDLATFFREFQDHLAPRLDTYEQAIYLYAFRLSKLEGVEEATIGFKSARKSMAFGIGEKGKPMSEGTCYAKVRSLAEKGCLEILASERNGTRLRIRLPDEIPGLLPEETQPAALSVDDEDFFDDQRNRGRILRREESRCFYCLRKLDSESYVIEHVTSRPTGDNGYRNVVAACRSCNNRKGAATAESHLRALLRDGMLSDAEFASRLGALADLRTGALKPPA